MTAFDFNISLCDRRTLTDPVAWDLTSDGTGYPRRPRDYVLAATQDAHGACLDRHRVARGVSWLLAVGSCIQDG
jgi:hypothetical protein